MKVNKVAVIGSGALGPGIAQVAALGGMDVRLYDPGPVALEQGLATIDRRLDRDVEKGLITAQDAKAAKGRISGYLLLEDAVAEADLVIEATGSDMKRKKELFRELDKVCGERTIMATNTATLSITEMASVTTRPERFIGMHFFQPIPKMKLVEIVRGHQTSDATAETAKAAAEKMGKQGIEVAEAPGFLVDRIYFPMINEAIFVLQEGLATTEEIDSGMKLGANHPMGPLAVADMIGLDRVLKVLDDLYTQYRDPKYRPAYLLVKMVRAGHLGKSTGKGFYEYPI